MPQPHLAKDGQNYFDLLKTEHNKADALHHVAALGSDISAKSRSQRGIKFEKPRVEYHPGMVSDRADLAERILDEGYFSGSHDGMNWESQKLASVAI